MSTNQNHILPESQQDNQKDICNLRDKPQMNNKEIFFINKKTQRPLKNTKAIQFAQRKLRISKYLSNIQSTIQQTFAKHQALDLSYLKVFTRLKIEKNYPVDFFPFSPRNESEVSNNQPEIHLKQMSYKNDSMICSRLFKNHNCSCQKNNCLKNYCDCKRNKEHCNTKCNCSNCSNGKKLKD